MNKNTYIFKKYIGNKLRWGVGYVLAALNSLYVTGF